MIKIFLLIIAFLPAVLLHAQTANEELVPIKQIIPGIVLDLKYSTTDNFTSQKLYTIDEAYLCLGAVMRLKVVQDSLRKITSYDGVNYPQGLGLKIYDGYRPRAVQYLMFEIFPDPTFVADPASGSVHNRGGAIDLSIVDLSTNLEIPMPTVFDFFGPEASHDYMNLPANVIANRTLLKNMMVQVAGFTLYTSEWWHYTYPPSSSYPLLDFQMK